MIRTVLFSVLAVTILSILQSTILQNIALWGVVPDLALIVLAFVSIRNGSAEGQITGFASGFAQDFLSSAPLGFNVLVKTLTGFVFGLFKGAFFIDILLMPILVGAAATLLKALSTDVLHLFFPSQLPVYDFLARRIWIETAYNALVSPAVFGLLSLLRPLFVTERRER